MVKSPDSGEEGGKRSIPRRPKRSSSDSESSGRSARLTDIFIVRHADAGEPRTGPRQDLQRHLSAKGRRDARNLAEVLNSVGIEPTLIITSPLKRALETARIISEGTSHSKKPVVWEELKPGESTEELGEKLSTLKNRNNVFIVGHEPGLSELVNDMIGSDNGTGISLSKGGIARIQVMEFTPKVRGRLKWLISPKLLKRIS